MMNRMMTRNWLNNANYLVNEKHTFTIFLKDGTTKIVKSKIHTDTLKHQSYLEFVNKEVAKSDSNRIKRIYPTQTIKISREAMSLDDNGIGPSTKMVGIEGISTDSCWRFKAISGKITAFSFLSEQYDLNTFYLNAFQVDNGEIQSLNPENLKLVIQSNEKAMKFFLKKDYYEAIVKFNKQFKN